jgi:hypothetical protein
MELEITIADFVVSRLWPNPVFRRLSGLAMFTPRSTFQTGRGPFSNASAVVRLNSNTVAPVPDTLRQIMGVKN